MNNVLVLKWSDDIIDWCGCPANVACGCFWWVAVTKLVLCFFCRLNKLYICSLCLKCMQSRSALSGHMVCGYMSWSNGSLNTNALLSFLQEWKKFCFCFRSSCILSWHCSVAYFPHFCVVALLALMSFFINDIWLLYLNEIQWLMLSLKS